MNLSAKLRSQEIMRACTCFPPREQFPLPARLSPQRSSMQRPMRRSMRSLTLSSSFFVLLLCSAALAAQTTSVPTALPSRPFSIRNTWFIGGAGDWDYLALDPQAGRLYIAHAAAVQVVDLETGALVGEIGDFGDTRDIALDPHGGYGYVSDAARAQVTVFDRETLQAAAKIPTDPDPHALVFDPQTRLLFVVCARPPSAPASDGRSRAGPPPAHFYDVSSLTVIDLATRSVLGRILLPGVLGFARATQNGQVFINVTDRNAILRLDASAVETLLRGAMGAQAGAKTAADSAKESSNRANWPTLDWSGRDPSGAAAGHFRLFSLGAACQKPTGLAVDGADMRLFVTCANMAMVVVNAETGDLVTALPVGPGADAVAYDPNRGQIFVASGGGDGSLTIIRRDVTDTYAVTQTLPTRRQARTLAVDPETGNVYLVTDYTGASRNLSAGFGALKMEPVEGSFQVLEIGT
jgi:DNA-binding beta-propeller fold protein YncE